MAQTEKKEKPAAVRDALAALAILRGEDAALAEAVQKILPGYAKLMAGRGDDVTVESLLAAARLGPASLKEALQSRADKNFEDYYTDIIASLSQTAAESEPHIYAMMQAAKEGDTAKILRLIEFGDLKQNNTLWRMAKHGYTAIASFLLDHGADIHYQGDYALRVAALHGHTDLVRMLLDRGANIHALQDEALFNAATNGHTQTVTLLLDRGECPSPRMNNTLCEAARGGQTATVDLLLGRGADLHADSEIALREAAKNGHTETVALLLDRGADISIFKYDVIRGAAKEGHTATVALLIDRGIKPENCVVALYEAARHGRNETVTLLLDRGVDIHAYNDTALMAAIEYFKTDTAALLLDRGANAARLSRERLEIIETYRQRVAIWQKIVRCNPPCNLEKRDPAVFKPALFDVLQKALKQEGYGVERYGYAYNAMVLFQSEERVLQYLKKWARSTKQPLHDIIQMIQLPDDLTDTNLADWGDAVLKHGPQMAKLVKFCEQLPSPAKSDDGKTWSYARTRAEIALHAFARAAEHPALATLCFEHAIEESAFNRALALTHRVVTTKNMPEITLDGERFDMAGVTFKKLANDDIRGLFLGELTNCCQSIGGFGEKCATHGFTSAQSGFYVIETAKGEIIGQSWAWRGEKGELCFDSLETLGTRVSDAQWQKLLKEVARELTTRTDHNVTALHVGLAGKTPQSLKDAFQKAAAQPVDYSGYRDSKQQIQVWKR